MKKSFIDQVREAQERAGGHDPENFEAHFVVGVEMDESGAPSAAMMVSHGTPFETLGMIELLMQNLQDTKKDILKKLRTKSHRNVKDVSKMLDSLPAPIREQVLKLKKQFDDAVESRDPDALRKAKEDLLNFKNPFSDNGDKDDDGGGFNINDFKGGMA